jgi:hypothetical protein
MSLRILILDDYDDNLCYPLDPEHSAVRNTPGRSVRAS